MAKRAFVISPIGKRGSKPRRRADEVLKRFIEPAVVQRGYNSYRGDQQCTPGMVMRQVVESILDASLIVAYVASNNPNVFYELAIAHTLRKPVVIMAEPHKRLPFDIAGTRVIELDDTDPTNTVRAIVSQIDLLHKAGIDVESPVQIPSPQLFKLLARTASLSEDELPDFSGKWSGYTDQENELNPGEIQKYHVGMELNSLNELFYGKLYMTYGDDLANPGRNSVTLNVHGTIQGSRFLLAQYENPLVPHHCGQAFLELHDDPNQLMGRFMGFGIQTQRVVSGTIVLRRSAGA